MLCKGLGFASVCGAAGRKFCTFSSVVTVKRRVAVFFKMFVCEEKRQNKDDKQIAASESVAFCY